MVEFHSNEHQHLIVLSPNRSLTWEANKKILFAMFAVNMVIGISFAAVGAWLILPFAGLEILLVGIGMYYVCWKLNFKQTITIEAESLTLQKGVYFPKEEWQWQTSKTHLLKQASRYRMSAPTLFLKHLNETIEIGDFLNRKEKIALREHLRSLGMPILTVKSE